MLYDGNFCRACGRAIDSKRADSRHCSSKCRQREYRARVAARRAADGGRRVKVRR
jgi:predicted nucleic acid-binding Zn ribbon protein